MVMSLYSDLYLYFLYLAFFRKPTRPSFIDKAGCTRQFESELSLHSLAPLFPIKEGFFRKPTSPPLTLREGPPLSPSPFPLRVQGMYKPPYSVLKPLRYKVGGPSEVYARRGVRDETAWL